MLLAGVADALFDGGGGLVVARSSTASKPAPTCSLIHAGTSAHGGEKVVRGLAGYKLFDLKRGPVSQQVARSRGGSE